MDRKTLTFSVLLIVSVAVTSLFWNFSSLAGIATANYTVHIRRSGLPPITVVFLKEDVVIADVIIQESWPNWQNLTLPGGEYLVKVYYADSGIYLKQMEIYVAKDIAFAIEDR